jgi:hypothetical protein
VFLLAESFLAEKNLFILAVLAKYCKGPKMDKTRSSRPIQPFYFRPKATIPICVTFVKLQKTTGFNYLPNLAFFWGWNASIYVSSSPGDTSIM